jgi:phenylalanine-4-hydroxylase
MRQEYEKYTAEDFEVWKILFERQFPTLPDKATQAYLDGIKRLGFNAERIPNFAEVNQRLRQYTGWQIEVVPGLIPAKEFFELLENRRFPSSTWLRKMEELDYLEEPDMFHDVFGHIPLLSNQALCDFLAQLSVISLRYIDNETAVKLIARLYWYTVEFGLIQEKEGLRIYGAGILSSRGETEYSLFSGVPEHLPFSVATILNTPFFIDRYQTQYFVIDSFEQLFNSIPEIEHLVAKAVEEELVLV